MPARLDEDDHSQIQQRVWADDQGARSPTGDDEIEEKRI